MRILTIKDVGRVISGATPKTDVKEYWDGDISWVTPKEISQLDSPYLTNTERKITETGFKSCSTTLLPKGSILFTSRAPIGLVAIADINVSTNQGFKSIILNDGFYPLYIYYILKYNSRQLNDLGTGTTFKELSKSTFEKFQIPVPDLSEQIKIATVLHKAESLIKQRKRSIDLLDDILKSTFLKMFFQFFHKTNSRKLDTLCTKITDGTHDTPERLKQGIKFITGKHIRPYVIDFENSDYVTEEVHKEIYRRCNPEFGDILYTNIGVNLGTAAMNNVNYEFSMKNVALLKLNQTLITSRYLEHVLNLPSRRNRILEMNSSGGAQQFLSLGQIKNIDIPVPPMESQKQFSEIVEKSEILKARFKNSLIELENLYGSLNQRAFKGELEINTQNIIDSIDGELALMEYGGSIGAQGLSNATDEKEAMLWRKELSEHKKDVDQKENLIRILKGSQPILENEKKEEKKEKLKTRIVSGKPVLIPTEKPIEIKKKDEKKSKLNWEKVSTQQAANWIIENYTGFHFTSEMLVRYLMNEHVLFPDYYSSEELKKNPKANDADDLKTLIFSALNNENPFLKLEQVFYNPEMDDINLTLRDEDFELIKNRTRQERTGVYLRVAK